MGAHDQSDQREAKFIFVGNYLCLDFANTQMIVGAEETEFLEGLEDLASWLSAVGIMDASESQAWLERWGDTREGKRAFERMLELRSALREGLHAVVDGRNVPAASIREINKFLAERPGYFQLELQQELQTEPQEQTAGEGFGYSFRPLMEAAVNAAAPVAESALWLLAKEDLERVKRCENPECPLFFYDTSKNHRRRWCRMQPCGNRMKAQAHYRRHRLDGV